MRQDPSAPPRFISEPVVPEAGSADIGAMTRGEPGLPKSFSWRDRRYEIAGVMRNWRTTGVDRGDTYVRRHWYEIETVSGERMVIYCDRRDKRNRWRLYTVSGNL